MFCLISPVAKTPAWFLEGQFIDSEFCYAPAPTPTLFFFTWPYTISVHSVFEPVSQDIRSLGGSAINKAILSSC